MCPQSRLYWVTIMLHRLSGSGFRVERPPNSSYQRDSVFMVFIKPFHPMAYVWYSESWSIWWALSIGCNLWTVNPEPGTDQFMCGQWFIYILLYKGRINSYHLISYYKNKIIWGFSWLLVAYSVYWLLSSWFPVAQKKILLSLVGFFDLAVV